MDRRHQIELLLTSSTQVHIRLHLLAIDLKAQSYSLSLLILSSGACKNGEKEYFVNGSEVTFVPFCKKNLTKTLDFCIILLMFYPRQILPELEKELTTDSAVVITGMRQVGKTTLLNYLFDRVSSPNKAKFDLENPLHASQFDVADFDRILPSLADFGIDAKERAFLFIDEIQNLPLISRVIKYLHDHYQTKFFVTGSSSFYMKQLFPESMVGRKRIFELFPLSFAEFLVFKGVSRVRGGGWNGLAEKKLQVEQIRLGPLYREYMEFGGFPGVVLQPDTKAKRAALEEAFKSYFEKDVKTLADLGDRGKLRDLILLLVSRVASRVEINKLASELGVSREKIYSYLQFLEETYFISLLPRFSLSVDVSSAGRRKLFFGDTGLANFLGKASLGQLLENSVFQNLRPNHKLSFYHKETAEIDFVVDDQIALEVKMTASRRDITTLSQRASAIGVEQKHVLSFNWSGEPGVILVSDL